MGQPTCGKTASNRLRRVDNFLLLYFFEAWKGAAAQSSAMKTYGPRQWFIHTAEALAGKGYKINLQKKFLSRGYLVWEL